jgi:5-methyltetrahydrofolate--homocysteine methyltransferase
MEALIQSIQENVINGQRAEVEALVRQALDANIPPDEILTTGLIAARAMQAGLAILKPFLAQGGIASTGKVVIGTVKGDLHDIGKNLVAMMLEGAGFEIIDLGTDAGPDKFITAIRENNANLIGMSALLTTTMSNMKLVVAGLKEAGLRDSVKVMIGGAPVTETYAKEIGADGYAPDASRAVTLAKSLMGN